MDNLFVANTKSLLTSIFRTAINSELTLLNRTVVVSSV